VAIGVLAVPSLMGGGGLVPLGLGYCFALPFGP